MGIKTIIPATDWFYVHTRSSDRGQTVHHLAAFALGDDGTVTGLVPVGAKSNGGNITPPRLMPVPSLEDGRYLHRDQMSGELLEAAKKR